MGNILGPASAGLSFAAMSCAKADVGSDAVLAVGGWAGSGSTVYADEAHQGMPIPRKRVR